MRRHRATSRQTAAHSGRFILRLPPLLHAALRAAAAAAGLSLNEYCVRRLAITGPAVSLDPGAAALVHRASTLTGPALIGVILYGSWARGEAAGTSDVDVLIVVDETVPLTRDLYRRWDEAPVRWHSRLIDPHFVRRPREPVAGGVWAEAALDGVVLFEREWQLSASLGIIRRDIAAGRLVRRFVHGQPYWTVAA